MNQLRVGFDRQITRPKGAFLLIDDEVSGERWSRFDPERDSFNVLHEMDYLKACELVGVMMALFPGGGSTLTKEDAEHVLLEAFLRGPRSLEEVEIEGDEPGAKKARHMVERLLLSPVLKRVLCGQGALKDKVVARVNRAELGEFDALALGLFLIGQFQGQIVVPDFGFYGRDHHVSLIRQDRLVCGLNFLDELNAAPKLRHAILLIKNKVGRGCLFEDAEVLAKYAGWKPGDVGFSEFVSEAIGISSRSL